MGTVANCVLGDLGALGRRFESCRPDFLKASFTSELRRLAFLLRKYDHLKSGQIVIMNLSFFNLNFFITNEINLLIRD